MPSETIYADEALYNYALKTKAEDQSVNQRLAELAEKGVEWEERGSDVL